MSATTTTTALTHKDHGGIDGSWTTRTREALADTAAITWRDVLRTTRKPEMLSFAVVMGVFFLVLFNYVFGGAIGNGTGVDYLQFLVPGVLVITALQGAQQTSTGLAADLSEGVARRFKSLPMNQGAVIAGRTFADAGRNIVSVFLVVPVAMLMGYRFASVAGALAAVALTVVVGYAFSWLGAAIAAKVRDPEMVGMLSMFWLFPLMLASTAFAPADSMPGWLQGFATYQPISVASDAVRALANGTAAGPDVLASLAWTVAMLAVLVPLSTRLYRKSL